MFPGRTVATGTSLQLWSTTLTFSLAFIVVENVPRSSLRIVPSTKAVFPCFHVDEVATAEGRKTPSPVEEPLRIGCDKKCRIYANTRVTATTCLKPSIPRTGVVGHS